LKIGRPIAGMEELKILVSGSSNEIILKDENCMLVLLMKG
jgi:hypothetical protein